jgi:hypothetical protein
MTVLEAMKLTNFSVEEVANRVLHHIIQGSLPGKTMKGLKVHALASLPPPPPQPDCSEWRLNRAIDDKGSVIERDSFSLAASATSCGNAPKWAIIVICVNGVGCCDNGNVVNCSEQAEE